MSFVPTRLLPGGSKGAPWGVARWRKGTEQATPGGIAGYWKGPNPPLKGEGNRRNGGGGAAARSAALALALLAATPAHAVLPDEQLADPALETRARALSQGLRCLVCQNESIDESHAPLARDLRLLLRERLVKGDSDEAARDYIVARYGSYVLLKPPVEGATLPLWLGPAAFVLIGGGAAYAMLRRRRRIPETTPLSATEAARVDALLAEDR